jgi:hypothetical protein
MAEAQAADLWCRRCGRPVKLTGNAGTDAEYRKAVHAATGQEMGAYGHLATPVDCEPPHWKSCRILTVEFEGIFVIEAWFKFLRADWAKLPVGTVARHFEADGEDELRLKLKAAVAGLWRAPAGDGPPSAAADR